MTLSPTRDRLGEIRERTQAARGKRSQAQKAVDAAAQVGDLQAEAVARQALAVVQQELETAGELERILLGQMAGVSGPGAYTNDSFLDDPSTLRELEQMAHSTVAIGRAPLGELMSRDTLLDTIRGGNWGAPQPAGRSGGTGTVTPYAAADPVPPASSRYGPWGGIAVQLRRRLRVLDLIDTQAMEGASFAYAVESGTFNAAETAELALKPQGDQVLTEAWVVAQTIAVYNKIQRQALADIPSLQQTMSNRLIYSVMRRVEDEIISGSGTANNLQGILATPGIGSITFSATEALSDLVLDGVTGILLAEAEPNGVIASPQDVATMLKLKASGSGERLDSDGAFSGTPDSMWGLPLITSTVMPAGTALVGDWSLGATLFIREGVHVLISDADQDDFIRNRATLLAESRVGLAVWQPKAFTLVHLA